MLYKMKHNQVLRYLLILCSNRVIKVIIMIRVINNNSKILLVNSLLKEIKVVNRES